MPDVSVGSRLRSWAYALRTTNPPPDGPVDTVTRWLVVTRAAGLQPQDTNKTVKYQIQISYPIDLLSGGYR